MHTVIHFVTPAMLCAATVVSVADNRVDVNTDTAGSGIVRELTAGEIVPIELFVSTPADNGVFGVDLKLAVGSDDVRIRSVEFGEAFGGRAARPVATHELPAARYRAVRTQSLRQIDRALGANGRAVPLATVELEILNGHAFESALVITARGALIGEAHVITTVLDSATTTTTPEGAGANRIPIVNTAPALEPAPVAAPAPTPEPWTISTAAVTFDVHEPGGQEPIEAITAGQIYELHYDAGTAQVSGFVAYTIADQPESQLAAVSLPASGAWADDMLFLADTDVAARPPAVAVGFPPGHYRCDAIDNQLWPVETTVAAPTGHLFDFVPAHAGDLSFELWLWRADFDNRHCVEMGTHLTLAVEPAE